MKNYLGIDIGGTRIKAVLLRGTDKQKPVLHSIPTPDTREAAIYAMQDLARAAQGDTKIAGIGIGVPGIIDQKTGVIEKAPNVPWLDGWRLADMWETQGVPVAVENDSRCFVLAESMWGAGAGYKNIVGLAIGTGIGGGIMINGALIRGVHAAAGEFGHMVLALDEKNIASSQTLEHMGAKRAFEKYGDRSAVIGVAVANLINVFDPEMVVLGGGGVADDGVTIEVIRNIMRSFVLSVGAKETPVAPAHLGDAAQAIGAGLLFKERGAAIG